MTFPRDLPRVASACAVPLSFSLAVALAVAFELALALSLSLCLSLSLSLSLCLSVSLSLCLSLSEPGAPALTQARLADPTQPQDSSPTNLDERQTLPYRVIICHIWLRRRQGHVMGTSESIEEHPQAGQESRTRPALNCAMASRKASIRGRSVVSVYLMGGGESPYD